MASFIWACVVEHGMSQLEVSDRDIVDRVEYAVCDVYSEIGTGFQENVYHTAVEEALSTKNISFSSQPTLNVRYNGRSVGYREPDIVIEGDTNLVVELKAKKTISDREMNQTSSYIKMLKMNEQYDPSGGILVNFPQVNFSEKLTTPEVYHIDNDYRVDLLTEEFDSELYGIDFSVVGEQM